MIFYLGRLVPTYGRRVRKWGNLRRTEKGDRDIHQGNSDRLDIDKANASFEATQLG